VVILSRYFEPHTTRLSESVVYSSLLSTILLAERDRTGVESHSLRRVQTVSLVAVSLIWHLLLTFPIRYCSQFRLGFSHLRFVTV